jgi:hypothetical protein
MSDTLLLVIICLAIFFGVSLLCDFFLFVTFGVYRRNAKLFSYHSGKSINAHSITFKDSETSEKKDGQSNDA